jgi:hypothetical protein
MRRGPNTMWAHRLIDGLIFLIAMRSGQALALSQSPVPVFIELFTSEGCSSCPPADAWLEKIDASQPVPGAEVIVLSEHVDYWDHDGWKDPYSSTALTERQNVYAREFGLNSPYTPQAIVDGQTELHLNDPQQAIQVFQKSAAASMIPLTIGRLSLVGSSPVLLRAHIEIAGRSIKSGADVYGAIALNRTESQVLRGENGGRHLTHVAVVEEIKKIGKLQKGRDFSLDFETKLPPRVDPNNLRFVVFLQQPDQGKVLGAAMSKPGS